MRLPPLNNNKERLRELNTRLGQPKLKVSSGTDTKMNRLRTEKLQHENLALKYEAELKRLRDWLQGIQRRHSKAGHLGTAEEFQRNVDAIKKVLK
jgi:hypothetical protein